jgi:NMD protein affecting ribosome stability and mRNA decay
MANPTKGPEVPGWRRGRGVGGTRHDSYKPRQKLPEPTVCPKCGAVYHKGRWTWAERPAGAGERTCPACRRIADHFPAGCLRILGDLGPREAELLNLVRNQEAAEKAEHPLERLMEIQRDREGLLVTTTGIHLARRIAEALQRAFHEHVEIQYLKEQDLVRVTWQA